MKFYSIKTLSALAMTALVSAAMLSGCTRAAAPNPAAKADAMESKKMLKVMASFYPMYDFAAKIGGDKAEVITLVPSGTEPHDWEPAAADIRNLEEADLFIYSGAGMEHWVDDVLASLDNKDLISVEASKGVALRDGHSHSHEEEEGAGEPEEEGQYDPHVWLSPLNAEKEMENIKNAYIKADPDNRDYYEANYELYASRFADLNQKFKDTLSSLPNKDIVVSHEAFGYLCDAYGLNQVGIEGLSPNSEPSPARMAEIIDFVRANHVRVIFFEELVSPKVAETIAKETGSSVQVLNPLEGLSDEELESGADYFSVMEENLKQLEAALK